MAKNILLVVVLAGLFILVHTAFGQSFGGTLPNPLQTSCGNDISCLPGKIADVLLIIAGPIASVMVLYGGFQMMTAGGEPEKFSQGRKTLLYAAVGFVIILLAKQVVPIIQAIFK